MKAKIFKAIVTFLSTPQIIPEIPKIFIGHFQLGMSFRERVTSVIRQPNIVSISCEIECYKTRLVRILEVEVI
jgi:hypothetical protein